MYLDQMNLVLDEIERHLTDEISYESLARILAMSIYEFRRIFSFIIGMPVSEYIRMRRLSMAVFDLQTTDVPISEIAVKYGYDSAATFSRAFKDIHGISPTAAREPGISVNLYPRVSLTVTSTGTQSIPFRLLRMKPLVLCGYSGISRETDSGCCEDVWDHFFNAGYHDRLVNEGLYGKAAFPYSYHQFAAYENYDNHCVRCTIGTLVDPDTPIPEGLDTIVIPAAEWCVFALVGTSSLQINNAYFHTVSNWLNSSCYLRDPGICNLEAYPTEGTDDSEQMPWQIIYPLKKK